MVIFAKKVVEAVENEDGVFEQIEPEFVVSFDFNKPIDEQPTIHYPRPNFANGGVVETYFVDPNDIGYKIDKSWFDEHEKVFPKE